MPRLTLEQVQHVARLAALSLSDAEALAMCDELGSILDFMASLDAVDVSAVEPTWHTSEASAQLRVDQVLPSTPREVLLAAAPDHDHGGFAVPKVLDGDE